MLLNNGSRGVKDDTHKARLLSRGGCRPKFQGVENRLWLRGGVNDIQQRILLGFWVKVEGVIVLGGWLFRGIEVKIKRIGWLSFLGFGDRLFVETERVVFSWFGCDLGWASFLDDFEEVLGLILFFTWILHTLFCLLHIIPSISIPAIELVNGLCRFRLIPPKLFLRLLLVFVVVIPIIILPRGPIWRPVLLERALCPI